MRKVSLFLIVALTVCLGCQWRLRPGSSHDNEGLMVINRYDRIEALYVTTGDFAALQQMKIRYPRQTRVLIENVLRLGRADDGDIDNQLYNFFQDSTLQTVTADVARKFDNVESLNKQLSDAFSRLLSFLPDMKLPDVYTQIGSFDQSIVVGDGTLGISLDKYMGADYPLYARFGYSDFQLQMMDPSFIVPDCLGFYLLSLYPLPADAAREERERHMGCIQYVVNCCMNRHVFANEPVRRVERYMKNNKVTTIEQLLNGSVQII